MRATNEVVPVLTLKDTATQQCCTPHSCNDISRLFSGMLHDFIFCSMYHNFKVCFLSCRHVLMSNPACLISQDILINFFSNC